MDASGYRLQQIKGYNLEYDFDGNLTRKYVPTKGGLDQRFYWNALSQLDSVHTTRGNVTTRVSYGYDGVGQRVRSVAPVF